MSSIQEKLNQLAATAGSANWADRLRKGDADAKAKLDARIAEEYRKMAERTGMSLSPGQVQESIDEEGIDVILRIVGLMENSRILFHRSLDVEAAHEGLKILHPDPTRKDFGD